MKKLLLILLILLSKALPGQSYIASMKLEVSANKTTNLVFPSNIVSLDRGNESIVVQKSASNILRVKAVASFTEETNLSVVTEDGKLYSFMVSYQNTPAHLNITVGNQRSVKTNFALDSISKKVLLAKPNLYGLRYQTGRVSISLIGLYVKDDVLFCKLKLGNHSPISFYPDQLRLAVTDSKQLKRTSSQDLPIQPLYILGDTSVIRGMTAQTIVLALSPLTVPQSKSLVVEVLEKNGGRNLLLTIRNRYLVHAKTISK